jgi:hypothetical protein
VAWRRMTGGISSVIHRLTIDHGSYRDVLVLRQYEHGVVALVDSDTAALVRDEATALRAVHDAGLPAPELIAADADGRESDGHCCLDRGVCDRWCPMMRVIGSSGGPPRGRCGRRGSGWGR